MRAHACVRRASSHVCTTQANADKGIRSWGVQELVRVCTRSVYDMHCGTKDGITIMGADALEQSLVTLTSLTTGKLVTIQARV
jgi:hypothetical protein